MTIRTNISTAPNTGITAVGVVAVVAAAEAGCADTMPREGWDD